MSKIDQRVYNFIMNFSASKLALLINGKWGAGKTYYIENILSEQLKELNKELLYVSLNGVKTVNEIYDSLFFSRFESIKKLNDSLIGKVSVSLAKAAFSIIGRSNDTANFSSSDFKQIGLTEFTNLDNTVIVFDDFERLSPNGDFREILGSIASNFINNSEIKVIIICDETNMTWLEEFTKIKEKYIGWSIPFENDFKDCFESMIKSYNEDYKIFLNTHKGFIIKTSAVLGLDNFRTILFALDVTQNIYKLLNGKSVSFIKSTIYMVFIYSIEFKCGEIFKIRNKIIIPEYLRAGISINTSKMDSEEKDVYLEKLKRYKTNEFFSYSDYEMVFYESIPLIKKVINDKVDLQELNTSFERSEKFVNQKLGSKYSKNVKVVEFFNYYSNKEFEKAYYELIEGVNNGELNLSEFVYFARVMYDILRHEKYLPFNKDTVDQIFADKIELIKDNTELDIMQINYITNSIETIGVENVDLYHSIIEAKEKLENEKYDESITQFIKNLSEENVTQNSFWELFNKVEGKKILGWLLKHYENRKILESFCYSMGRLADNKSLAKHYEKSKKHILGLKIAIEKEPQFTKMKRIDIFWKDQLLKSIQYFEENFASISEK